MVFDKVVVECFIMFMLDEVQFYLDVVEVVNFVLSFNLSDFVVLVVIEFFVLELFNILE